MAYALAGLGRDAAARAERAAQMLPPGRESWLWLAARLQVVRRGQASGAKLPQLRTAADVSRLIHGIAPTIATDPQEQTFVVAVDVMKKPLAVATVYRGTLTRTPANPSNLLRIPLLVPAVGFFAAHTHPQGSPKPSMTDLESTAHLVRAADLVGLRLLDHVVLTPNAAVFYSIRDHHPDLWGAP